MYQSGFDYQFVVAFAAAALLYLVTEELEEETEDEELIDRCLILTKGSPVIENQVTPAW